MSEGEAKPLVDLWDVTGVDMTFGGGVVWPKRNDPRLAEVPRQFEDVASSLFYDGGKIADHGLKLKGGVDARRFHGCLRAMLASWEPPHEVKLATAGSLIQHYCEPI